MPILTMSFSDWNHFIRPNLWAFGLAIFIIGILSTGVYLFTHIIGAIVAILLCTASITLNHYFDYNTDKKSKQLYRFPVAAGRISKSTALIFSVLTMLISILLTYIFLDILSLYLVLFANFMIYSYSAPPLRIKERPYLEIFWNAAGYGWVPYYLALFISGISITISHHLLGLIPFFISGSGHILLQVRDIKDDIKGGVKTTSTKHGLKIMKKVSVSMILISGLIIIYLTLINFLNPLGWIAIIAGAFVVREHRKMKSNVEKRYRTLQVVYIIGGLFFILSIIRF